MGTLTDKLKRSAELVEVEGFGQVGDREQAIIDRYRKNTNPGSLRQKLADAEAKFEIDTRQQQRAYAEQAPPEAAAPVKEMLSSLGDRSKVLDIYRKMSPEQRQEALKLAPGLAQQLGDDRGGAVNRTLGALSRGVSHGVSQPVMELTGMGGTDEEIEYIRQLDAAASQEFSPARPGDPWYQRGPLQATEMAPWMSTVVAGNWAGNALARVGGQLLARGASAGVPGAKAAFQAVGAVGKVPTAYGLKGATTKATMATAGGLAGTTAAAFPSQYAQEVDQLKEMGMEDGRALRLLAGGTAAISGLIEGIVPNPLKAGPVSLTEGAVKAARQYLWNAAKQAPGEMSEEYLQGVTSGLGKHVAQYLDANVEDKSIVKAFDTGYEQAKEAALPMAFLLGVPAAGGAGVSAVQARLARLQEVRAKGFVSLNDAKNLNIEGKNRKERLANTDKQIEELTQEIQTTQTPPEGESFPTVGNLPEATEQSPADPATPPAATQPGATLEQSPPTQASQDPAAESQGTTQTFQTASGSTYELHPDGTTTRNRAERGDGLSTGPQPRSAKTWFADDNELNQLYEQWNNPADVTLREITDANGEKRLATYNHKTGQYGNSIKFSTEPKPGLIPVEYWSDDMTIHYGNKIVDATKPAATPITEWNGVQKGGTVWLSGTDAVGAKLDDVDDGAAKLLDILPSGELLVKQSKGGAFWIKPEQVSAKPPQKSPDPERDQAEDELAGLLGEETPSTAGPSEETGTTPTTVPPTVSPDAPAKPETSKGETAGETQPSEARAGEPRRGKVGDMLAAGEVVTTSSGRPTTPFPKIDTGSDRKAQNTIKRVDKWLHENAVEEARSRGDDFNLTQFENEDPAKLPPASKDAMEEYLFGEQPPVLKPFTKPLVPPAGAADSKGTAAPPATATVDRDADIDRAISNFKNIWGMEATATPVDKLSAEQQEALDFATSRGQKLAFVDIAKSDKKAPIGSFQRGDKVVLISNELKGDKLWGMIGHEMAHSKGLDEILPADSAELKQMMDEYYASANDDVRKRLRTNKRDHMREGRARMVQKFFEDKAFRDQLMKDNPTLWEKLREAVLKFIGKWTPKDEAKRMLLDELRAAPKPQKRTGKKPQPETGGWKQFKPDVSITESPDLKRETSRRQKKDPGFPLDVGSPVTVYRRNNGKDEMQEGVVEDFADAMPANIKVRLNDGTLATPLVADVGPPQTKPSEKKSSAQVSRTVARTRERAAAAEAEGITPYVTVLRTLSGGRRQYEGYNPTTGERIATGNAIAGPGSVPYKLSNRKGRYQAVDTALYPIGESDTFTTQWYESEAARYDKETDERIAKDKQQDKAERPFLPKTPVGMGTMLRDRVVAQVQEMYDTKNYSEDGLLATIKRAVDAEFGKLTTEVAERGNLTDDVREWINEFDANKFTDSVRSYMGRQEKTTPASADQVNVDPGAESKVKTETTDDLEAMIEAEFDAQLGTKKPAKKRTSRKSTEKPEPKVDTSKYGDTPIGRQFAEAKAAGGDDTILFFRMGDFYELYFEDAQKAARILGLTLVTRDKSAENPIPMAGFPYHQIDGYLQKLKSAGFRVAVNEAPFPPKRTGRKEPSKPKTRIQQAADTARQEADDLWADLKKMSKDKFTKPTANLDPELAALAVRVALAEIKAGTLSFAAFVQQTVAKMPADMLDKLKPYMEMAWKVAHKRGMTDDAGGKFDDVLAASEQSDETRTGTDGNTRVENGTRQPDGNGTTESSQPDGVGATEGSTGQPGDRLLPDTSSTAGDERGDGSAGDGTDGRADADQSEQGQPDTADTGTGSDDGGVADRLAVDHVIAPDDDIAVSSLTKSLARNISALEILKALETEGRFPDESERKALAQYTGWGGLSQALDSIKGERMLGDRDWMRDPNWEKQWGKAYVKLKELLTKEEFEAAQNSTENAHYTSKSVIQSLWKIAERLGFKGGRVLELGAGVGHFAGLMPSNVRGSTKFIMVELDSVSSRIAKMLYPNHEVFHTDMTEFKSVPGSVTMGIGNVPFAGGTIEDSNRRYGEPLNLHNYAFARHLDAVAPGGIVVAISTHNTLDKNIKQRQFLSSKGDLIGAIRLPNDAFAENAKTQVVTDILIFRRPKQGEPKLGVRIDQNEDVTVKTKDGREVVRSINKYFIDNPQMVLGAHSAKGSMYGADEYTVESTPGDLQAKLDAAIDSLPLNLLGQVDVTEQVVATDKSVPFGRLEIQDGKVVMGYGDEFVALNGQKFEGFPVHLTGKTGISRAKDYIELRDLLAGVRSTMLDENASDDDVKREQRKLSESYDRYVDKHGPLSAQKTNIFVRDPDYYRVLALENERSEYNPDTKKIEVTYTKAAIFTQRVLGPQKEPESAGSPADAMSLSIAWRGAINAEFIGKLLGVSAKEAEAKLLEEGLAFRNPATTELELADLYLSGNVRTKLAQAKISADEDPQYQQNVEALTKVLPEPVTLKKDTVRLGATWIPENVINAFASQAFGTPVAVTYNANTDAWTVGGVGAVSEAAKAKYKTGRVDPETILSETLNLRSIKVYDRVETGEYTQAGKPKTTQVLNEKETQAAKHRASVMRADFEKWVMDSPDVSQLLAKLYNDKYNNFVRTKYNGDFLVLPGANPEVKLRPYQKSAIWRILNRGTSLLAHAVGSGKTYTMIGAAMEMRRLGLARRPVLVVQNATLGQFATSFQKMYPNANILVANKDDLGKGKRQLFLNKISTGNWDAVVMAQSTFDNMASDPAVERAFIQDQLDLLEEAIREEGGESAGTPTVKQLVRSKKSLRKRFDQLIGSRSKKADNVTFEDLGADALFLDEAHAYKKPAFTTKLTQLVGLNTEASARSLATTIKVRSIQGANNGRNVILATGTPVTNTLGEAWHMVNYVSPATNAAFSSRTFDQFIGNFAQVEPTLTMNAGGQYVYKDAIVKFRNGHQLVEYINDSWDIVTPDQLRAYMESTSTGFPKLRNGQPTAITVDRTPGTAQFMDFIDRVYKRFKALPAKERRAMSFIPAIAYGASKAATLDIRLVNPNAAEEKNSKLQRAAEEIKRIYDESMDTKGTQLFFSDMKNPFSMSRLQQFMGGEEIDAFSEDDTNTDEAENDSDTAEVDDNESGSFLYQELRKKLIASGIPAEQIAFIAEAKTDKQRQALFERVNNGDIRVLIGSTSKMGVGVNVQKKLVALHHFDTPWLPADLEQREGRILRFGNENEVVDVLRYAMKKTLDGAIYMATARKQKFIWQVLNGQLDGDSFEDPSSAAMLSIEEQLAAIQDDPVFFEKIEVQNRLRELELERQSFYDAQQRMADSLSNTKSNLRYQEATNIPRLEARAERIQKMQDEGQLDNFSLTYDKQTFTDPKKAAEFIKSKVDDVRAYILKNFDAARTFYQVDGGLPGMPAKQRVQFTIGPFNVVIAAQPMLVTETNEEGKEVTRSSVRFKSSAYMQEPDGLYEFYDGTATVPQTFFEKAQTILEETKQNITYGLSRISDYKAKIDELEKLLEKQWEDQEEYDQKKARLAEIEQQMLSSEGSLGKKKTGKKSDAITRMGQYVLPEMPDMVEDIDRQDFVRKYRDRALEPLWGWSSDPADAEEIQEAIDMMAPSVSALMNDIYAGKLTDIDEAKGSEAYVKAAVAAAETDMDATILLNLDNAIGQAISDRPEPEDEAADGGFDDGETPSQPKTKLGQLAEKANKELGDAVDEFGNVIKGKLGMNLPLNPEVIAAAAKVVAKALKAGTLNFAELMERMVAKYGEKMAKRMEAALRQEWDRQVNAYPVADEDGTPPETPQPHPELVPPEAIPLTSVKNAIVDELRAQRGETPMPEVTPQTVQQWLDAAGNRIASDPYAGNTLVEQLLSGEKTSVDEMEGMVLQYHYRAVNNLFEAADTKLTEAKENGDAAAIAIAQDDARVIMRRLAAIETALDKAGTAWGRAGVSRQIFLKQDFSLASMVRRARVANGGNELSDEQVAKISEQAKQIEDLQKRIAELEAKTAEQEQQKAIDAAIKKDIEETKKPAEKPKSKVRLKAEERVASAWEKVGAVFKGKLYANPLDPELLKPAMELIKAYADLGMVTFREFMYTAAKNMGAKQAKAAEPTFRAAWDQLAADGEIAQPSLDITNAGQLTRFARRVQRSLIENGVTEREEIVDAVHDALREILPEITRRQTMDALSSYGQFSQLSKDPIDQIIRDINGQLQQLAKLEDMEKGIAPAKTGVERRTQSDEERRLTKLVNEAKRRGGFVVTDPETQLKSALAAAKTAVRNRIADMTFELTPKPDGTYSRIVRNKTELIPDAELEQLRKDRDELQKVHKAMFPPKGATQAQKIASANRALDAAIASLEAKLAAGDVSPAPQPKPLSTPELDAKRARLKGLNDQRNALRKMDEQTRVRALDRSIEALEKELAAGDFTLKPKPTPLTSPEINARQAKLESLRATKKALVAAANPDMAAQRASRAYEAHLRTQLAMYLEKIAQGDFDPKPKKPPRVLTKAELDLKKQLADVKHDFFEALSKYHLDNLSPMGRAVDIVRESAHLSRAIMTSFDLSAVLRQGGLGVYSHPVIARKAAAEMWQSIWSREAEFQSMEKLRARPNAQLYEESGLNITDSEGKLTRQEEAFMGRWARTGVDFAGKKVQATTKLALEPVAASARAYVTFINNLRADLFDAMVENLGQGGAVTKEEAKLIAKYINVATGRSDLKALNDAAATLNTVFFAPRYVASRFQYLAMPFYLLGTKDSARVKRLIAMEYARTFTGAAVFIGSLAMLAYLAAGDDEEEKPSVEFNPLSADFGKVRIDETRVDPLAGLAQVIVFSARMASFHTKSSTTGKIKPFYDGGPFETTHGSEAWRFLRTKLAPVPGAVVTAMSGMEDVVGNPVTPAGLIAGLFVPISVGEVISTMQHRGIPKGTAMAILNSLGAAVNTYGPKTAYIEGTPEERAKMVKDYIKYMNWESDLPAFSQYLPPEDLKQVQDRQDERRGDLVFEAMAPLKPKDEYKSEAHYEEAKERHEKVQGEFEEFRKQFAPTYSDALRYLLRRYDDEGGVKVQGAKKLKPGFIERRARLAAYYQES